MGIDPKFTQAEIKARFDKFIAVIEKRQIRRLQRLGEECVTLAKSIPKEIGFQDQTGNLRASMGYTVFVNGIAVRQAFEGSSQGQQTGKAIASKAGSKYKEGICLVVVAGMSYALTLESKGRDVLTSAELYAKQELPKLIAELKRNINTALG